MHAAGRRQTIATSEEFRIPGPTSGKLRLFSPGTRCLFRLLLEGPYHLTTAVSFAWRREAPTPESLGPMTYGSGRDLRCWITSIRDATLFRSVSV